MLALEPFFAEPAVYVIYLNAVSEGPGLRLEITTFQADKTVGECVLCGLGDVLPYNLGQLG